MKAPFPYFGGKSRAAGLIWERLGNPAHYIEPFAGSLAVLLARPGVDPASPPMETVNDLDGMIANFWRAVRYRPDETAEHADWPVNETDLHARHRWLVDRRESLATSLDADPEWCDPRIAGWWVWGACAWIAGGWCSGTPHRKLPHLSDLGRGIHASTAPPIREWFRGLSTRLRRVRVACGDWTRVLGPSVLFAAGDPVAILLDPPYSHSERDVGLYAEDHDVAADVRAWCAEHGQDPRLRIALCGYEGEGHEVLEADDWAAVEWSGHGGYGRRNPGGRGMINRRRERVWFSPGCLDGRQLG